MAKSKVPNPEESRNDQEAPSFDFGANSKEPEQKKGSSNPFSREALRLNHNFAEGLGLEKHVHNIPVDKPPAESWFRVHPDKNEDGEDMIFDTYLLHLKNGPDRGIYQVSADLLSLLSGERMLRPTRLVLCIDRQQEVRFWPLRLPGPDGREDDWMSSSLAIAEQAKERWVRMLSEGNGYISMTTSAEIPEPIWPSKSLDELLDLAFSKRRIASENDPILRRLREGL